MEGVHAGLLWPGEFSINEDGYCHRKTVPYYIFAQAVAGRYVVEANGEKVDCGEGGAFLAHPDMPLAIHHRLPAGGGPLRARFLHFRMHTAEGLDALAPYRLPLRLPRELADPVGELVTELLALPGNPRNDSAPAEEAGGVETLATALRRQALGCRALALLLAAARPAERPAAPAGVLRALRLIAENAGREIVPAELTRAAEMSRSGFYRAFLAATGLPPAEYILRERINHAARLLLEHPEYGVKEVAHQGGWKNPFHFSRAFKKVLGRPPAAYRDAFYL